MAHVEPPPPPPQIQPEIPLDEVFRFVGSLQVGDIVRVRWRYGTEEPIENWTGEVYGFGAAAVAEGGNGCDVVWRAGPPATEWVWHLGCHTQAYNMSA